MAGCFIGKIFLIFPEWSLCGHYITVPSKIVVVLLIVVKLRPETQDVDTFDFHKRGMIPEGWSGVKAGRLFLSSGGGYGELCRPGCRCRLG